MKRKTIGIDPKLPITAIVAVIVYTLAKFGIDLDPTLAAAIAAFVGIIGGAAGPAAKVSDQPTP
jgi:small-conductance mechanosensitive channel